MVKKGLTIAGSDTWGGGGITSDLKTFENFGIFGVNAITSLAVKKQDSFQIETLSPELLSQQLKTLKDVFPLHGIKIGLLGSIENIQLVLDFITSLKDPIPLVIDPVLAFKESDTTLEKSYLEALIPLLEKATIITPNLHEAELLLNRKITNIKELQQGSIDLAEKLEVPVVIKGGRRLETVVATDYFYDGNKGYLLKGPFSQKNTVNGAGCSFATAICSQLILGHSLLASVTNSKEYVFSAIETGVPLKDGGNVWHQGEKVVFPHEK